MQVSPALCVAGVLSHPCEPDESAPCSDFDHDSEHPESSSHPESGSCSHEGDCDSDPCQQLTVTKEARTQDSELANLSLPLSILAASVANVAALGVDQLVASAPPLLSLPVYESDLPLLI